MTRNRRRRTGCTASGRRQGQERPAHAQRNRNRSRCDKKKTACGVTTGRWSNDPGAEQRLQRSGEDRVAGCSFPGTPVGQSAGERHFAAIGPNRRPPATQINPHLSRVIVAQTFGGWPRIMRGQAGRPKGDGLSRHGGRLLPSPAGVVRAAWVADAQQQPNQADLPRQRRDRSTARRWMGEIVFSQTEHATDSRGNFRDGTSRRGACARSCYSLLGRRWQSEPGSDVP